MVEEFPLSAAFFQTKILEFETIQETAERTGVEVMIKMRDLELADIDRTAAIERITEALISKDMIQESRERNTD